MNNDRLNPVYVEAARRADYLMPERTPYGAGVQAGIIRAAHALSDATTLATKASALRTLAAQIKHSAGVVKALLPEYKKQKGRLCIKDAQAEVQNLFALADKTLNEARETERQAIAAAGRITVRRTYLA